MSAWGIAILATAYALPTLIGIGIAFRSSWPWPARAGALTITAALYAVTLLSMPQLLGWPTAKRVPAKFRLISADVQQPDKVTRDPGAVYLWLTDAADLAGSPAPRAYRLPYSAALHETVTNATAKLQNGMPQLGEYTGADSGAVLLEPPGHSGPAAVPLKFYDMSDPLFPDK